MARIYFKTLFVIARSLRRSNLFLMRFLREVYTEFIECARNDGIKTSTKNRLTYLKDLTTALTAKELKAKYKSTLFGVLWMGINPLLQMVVLTIVFSLFIKLPIKDYPIFVFSGLLPWNFFALSVQSGTSSLISNRDLIKKVKFPYEVLPISSVLAQAVTFVITLLIFITVIVGIKGISFSLLFIIPLVLLQLILAIGISLLLSSLDLYYRDVSFLLQAVITIWFYITPIIYPLSTIPENYVLLYALNPMVGIILGYQKILYGLSEDIFFPLLISTIISVLFAIIGYWIFKHRSKYFADWI